MAGTGFDDPGVFYTSFFPDDRSESEGGDLSRTAATKQFKEFLKTFQDSDHCFCYRCVLAVARYITSSSQQKF